MIYTLGFISDICSERHKFRISDILETKCRFEELVRSRRPSEDVLSTRLRDFDLDCYRGLLSWLLTS